MSNLRLNIFLKKRIVLGLCLTLFLGVLLEIWLMNRLSTFGEQIAQLEKTSVELQLENQIIKNEIDQKRSFAEVNRQADYFGFSKEYSIEYLPATSLALSSR